MKNERREISNVGRFLTQELLPVIRDAALEPIRFSQALKQELTVTSGIPNYQALDRATRIMYQARGYVLGYLPIEMPVAIMASTLMQGNIVGGLLFGGAVWMTEGLVLRDMKTREQS